MDSDELPLSRSTLDRDALTRLDPAIAWNDPRLRILPVHKHQVATVGERLDLWEIPDKARTHANDMTSSLVDLAPSARGWAYLGKDHLGPVIALLCDHPDPPTQWRSLRSVGALLSAREAGLATAAVALANWHATHVFCPRCGHKTHVIESGWVRECPHDGGQNFPRTDAAVIMAIVDSFDRLLLAHNAMWPSDRYSVPAGYVEPGEPLEAAVRREVWEETGIRVGKVRYQGSQPWPFPASLMVGFRGEALTNSPIPDGEEITHARFVTREELAREVEANTIKLPGATSIARYLIEDWFGGRIPD